MKVGDIVWRMKIGEIEWLMKVGDIVWRMKIGEIVWLMVGEIVWPMKVDEIVTDEGGWYCVTGYKDVYLPVTLKCGLQFVLVIFHSYSALTNRQNITVSLY